MYLFHVVSFKKNGKDQSNWLVYHPLSLAPSILTSSCKIMLHDSFVESGQLMGEGQFHLLRMAFKDITRVLRLSGKCLYPAVPSCWPLHLFRILSVSLLSTLRRRGSNNYFTDVGLTFTVSLEMIQKLLLWYVFYPRVCFFLFGFFCLFGFFGFGFSKQKYRKLYPNYLKILVNPVF